MIRIESGNILDDKYTMICHQVNTLGIMGGGLARKIKEKFPEVYKEYNALCGIQISNDALMGNAEPIVTDTEPIRVIYNIFAQNRIDGEYPRTNYSSLKSGFCKILLDRKNNLFTNHNTLAIPYGIGCGLAGGDWSVVQGIIKEVFMYSDLDVVIVKFPEI